MDDGLKTALQLAISEATGSAFDIEDIQSQSGGCINQAIILKGASAKYFVKINSASAVDMFKAESAALVEMANSESIRVPRPFTVGTDGDSSYLVLEALSFGTATPGSWVQMGKKLAQLHRKSTDHFGWHRDNTIGSSPQHNTWASDWPTFFREQRLRPQFEMAGRNGYRFEKAEKLLSQVDALLEGHSPSPSLLHGDLWSGNAGFLEDGTPVIYDPATYYGDRETDLAFSELFGGFPREFYSAYDNEWPLEPGYKERKPLYNLYHVLNHANLFGGGYPKQALSITNFLVDSI